MMASRWWYLPAAFVVAMLAVNISHGVAAPGGGSLPNVVIIYADDLGYGDLGCYGSNVPTPNLDRMAKEGARFTNFYVAQAVCSASRAALLTGCYPNRIGIRGALSPNNPTGINPKEQTIAEVLKPRGYATAIFGKWHLGDREPFLPPHHGFDEYLGLPYSNDMRKAPKSQGGGSRELPLIEGTKTVEIDPDLSKLTTLYTERAVKFIDANKDRPFFLYVPHTMPHVPIAVSDKFKGKSPRGMYGDVIMEIDWSVGQILDKLKSAGLDEKTLVVFASDNGPWLRYGDHAGSSGPLREGKGTSFEGGVRVPGIFRWPGKIAAGRECAEPVMTIDLLPTIAKLAGAEVSPERKIDGLDIWPLIAGEPGAKSPHEALYIYWINDLQAIRSGKWKLHFPHDYRTAPNRGTGGVVGPQGTEKTELALFDLEADIGETKNVAAENPEVVKRLQALAEVARDDLGDGATNRVGKNVREPGKF
jgi:arylsulfatase A